MSEVLFKRLLLLHDDALNSDQFINQCLPEASFQLDSFTSPAQAQKALSLRNYDLIIASDFFAQQLSAFLDELQHSEFNADCPVLVLCSDAHTDFERLLSLGVSEVIRLPWEPVILMTRMKHLIAESQLLKSQQLHRRQMQFIFDDMNELICRYTPEGIITFANNSFCTFIHRDIEDLIGSSYFDLLPPEHHEILRRQLSQFTAQQEVHINDREIILQDGSLILMRWTDRVIFDDAGHLQGFQSIGMEYHEPIEVQRELQHTRRLLHEAQCVANLAGWELDAQTREFTWTEHIFHMLELHPESGLRMDQLQDMIPEQDFGRLRRALDHALREGNAFDLEFRAILSNQREVWLRALGQPELIDGYIYKIWGAFQDITEQKMSDLQREKMRERLEYDATHDQLTDLFNRSFYMEQLGKQYELALRHQHPMTICICDVDHISQVNENYGHTIGDHVLRHVAKSLKISVRSCDYVARYGGEEFAMLFPMTAPGGSAICIKRALESLRKHPVLTDFGGEIKVTATFGLAGFEPDLDHSVDHLLRRAEQALQTGKQQGRDCFVIAQEQVSPELKRLDVRMD